MSLESTQKQFTHDSDHFSTNEYCNEILITAEFYSDYSTEILEIFDLTANVERKLADFPENERQSIKKQLDRFQNQSLGF